jgi:methyltransferase (TIGR00027 family)
VRDGQPSRTARHVAAYRLGFERLTAPYGDPDADHRLAADVADDADFEPAERMAGYLRLRTAFFDRVVVNALERGTTQVAMIGAGYDGRALRYAKDGVRWFEIDHPATQADKRQRLARLGIATTNVTFVATDLVSDDVADAMTGAGFEPDAPSLLLCEGVAVYLEPVVLADLLARLRSIATAGTRLALSSRIFGADAARRETFAARVAELGEPITLGGADVDEMLTQARWRAAELSERAHRAGMVVAVPIWEPGVPATASAIGTYLERTFHRDGIDRLAEHLRGTYGIAVTGTRRLDVGVVRVERADGPAWVARIFPAARPLDSTRADAEALRYLESVGYPAERLADSEPVSEHEGQAVLVTEHLDGKPRSTQQLLHQLGELLGRLHALPDPPDRPGGGWHHLVLDGGPGDEIAALQALLDAHGHVPNEWRAELDALRDEVDQLDDLHDLPHAFTHPDFVAANTIITPDKGPVIIDWTGAGLAPRLWTLAFLLWSAGMSGPRYVDAAIAGYRTHVQLTPDELDQLQAAIAARPLIFDVWSYVTGRRPLLDIVAQRGEVQTKAHDIATRARHAFDRP